MIKKLLFGLVCLFPCLSIKAQTESFDYYENGKWGCIFQYYDFQAKEYCSFSVFPQYDATCFVWYNEKNGGYFMAKKKDKIKSLTEEQYNDYLMALKDERPTMLIDKDGKRTPQR